MAMDCQMAMDGHTGRVKKLGPSRGAPTCERHNNLDTCQPVSDLTMSAQINAARLPLSPSVNAGGGTLEFWVETGWPFGPSEHWHILSRNNTDWWGAGGGRGQRQSA